ncbi:methylmalonate-semialdehyde dehydrogenase [Spirochaetota bacterium]|nr:methylmalonate-semialdehyde dehydrogenase [Spirochaetota bacterium]
MKGQQQSVQVTTSTDDPRSADQDNTVKEYKHYIDGAPRAGTSGKFENVYNPALGKIIGKAPLASRAEMTDVIQCANKAFASWRNVPPAKRAAIMYDFRALIIKHEKYLTELISMEHGKVLADARGSLLRGLEIVEFCTGITSHLKADFTENISTDIDSYNMRQPLGVCAGITPFNFPAMVPMWMFPLAIACGNTFILKPSEKDPSVSLYLAKLFTEAGLPDGVFNVVIGAKEAVDTLLEHETVKAVSFVGSTAVGEYVYKQGTSYGKRVQALCGAKNHMVIMPDADLDKTCDALMGAVYGSAGERCMAISVAVAVGDDIAEAVIAKLKPMVENLKIGAYTDAGIEMGPVISSASLKRIKDYIAAGEKAGAKLVIDGRAFKSNQTNPNGYFIGGTILDHVTSAMSVYTDEIFGPVLSLVRAKTYNEALTLVNNHEYGNGAAIFTGDGDTARHFSHHCEAGMVGVNIPIPVPVSYHSFGGWKRSIFGSSAIHGMEGVRFYTKLKTVTTRWFSGIRRGAEFHFSSSKDH